MAFVYISRILTMSKMWKPQPIEVYKDWLLDILVEASDNLNDWESSFIANLQMRVDCGLNLSQSQAEKLEQIYVKYTS